VFLASDSLGFACSLADVGGGWTFAGEAGSWWIPGSVLFSVDDEPIQPESVWPLAGRVSFSRCLRGRTVTARGSHYPTVVAASAASWALRVLVPLGETSGLADEHRTFGEAPGRSATATLDDCRVEPWLDDALAGAHVLALLPYSSGLMVGVGVASFGLADTTSVQVLFDDGEVSYVR
jgi:hypothetical protein